MIRETCETGRRLEKLEEVKIIKVFTTGGDRKSEM